MTITVKSFQAPWCNPCKAMEPLVEKVMKDYEDMTFEVIDIDDHGDVAAKYGVSAVPTLVFERDGEILGALVGMHKEHIIREKFENVRNK